MTGRTAPPTVHDRSSDAGSLVLETDLPAAPAVVLSAWTDAGRLQAWWPPLAELDARPGGSYAFAWPDQGWTLRGTFDRLDAAGLAFSWRWDHRPELPDRDVAVTLLPAATPGWTTLRLGHGPYHPGPPDAADRRDHDAGWRHFLVRLHELLADDSPAR